MSRERHETTEQKTREQALAAKVERAHKVKLQSLSSINAHYGIIDYLACALTPPYAAKAWIELKCRYIRFGDFSTIMLSVGKWAEGVKLAQATGIPFVLVFEFTNGVWRYKFKPEHLPQIRTEFGGRTVATRDDGDIEPVVHIPIALWEHVDVPAAELMPERKPEVVENTIDPAVEYPF